LEGIVAEASVIHIHGLWQEHGLAAAAVARKLNVPYIVSAHGMLDARALRAKRWKKELYAAIFERRNLAGASALRALTRAEVDDYRRFGLKAPVVVIPNGVSFPKSVDPRAFLNRFPKLANQQLILYLGRLHPQKGVDLLIRAWRRIGLRFPDAHLVLAGPDEAGTQADLVQLAAHLGSPDRITFTGMLQGDLKWSALAAAEVFVLPSHSEGFSVATLEAMACSRPVIVTRQCKFPDVAQCHAGLVTEPDECEIETALIDLLTLSAAERAAMGARGLELVRSKYSLTSVARSMAEVYEWLIGRDLPRSVEVHLV
jgi:glycosyltransferase involved in cell wall biosynthesis